MVGPGTKLPDWVGIPVGVLIALFLVFVFHRAKLGIKLKGNPPERDE
jgi:hypothetical protein